MNRFVQKLIAGAAAVAIAVTGLVGGASTAKAADPKQPTDGTITIVNNESASYDHTFEGWRLATLKNVTVTGAGENASINFEIDTTNDFVPVIEEVMGEMSGTVDGKSIKEAYNADGNYNGTVNGTKKNPMGFLIDKVFKTGDNATVESTESQWKGSGSALREFATLLAKKTLTTTSTDDYKADFASAKDAGFENKCKQGFWFLKDITAAATDTNKDEIESQSIPMLLATKLVNPDGQTTPDYAAATSTLGTVTLKANEPSIINKEITEVNGAAVDPATKTNARIGDKITYTLTTTIPYYTGYNDSSRVLQLIDTASKGLTVTPDSVKSVTLKKSGETDVVLNKGTDYTVGSDKYNVAETEASYKEEYKGGTVTTIDLAKYVNKVDGSTSNTSPDGILEGATVTVEFEATVNNNAVIASTGNPNTVELNYSRTPSGEAHQVPGHTVRVYTYDFSIHKTNMAGDTALSDAQFAIARVDANNTETFMKVNVSGMWSDATNGDLADGKPTVDGNAAFRTNDAGNISMKGLPAGTYHVYEIKAPGGYTSIGLPDFKFTIDPKFDNAGTTVTSVAYVKADNTDARTAFDTDTPSQANVKNAKNLTELPLTGDLGIKVFITVGVLLMAAGAAFALSARMRS